MASRHFTVDEARALVPWLAETFRALAPARKKADRLTAEVGMMVERLRSNGGSDGDRRLDLKRRALKEASDLISERLRAVQERGILVKSAEQGLVDLPSLRDGREVYLCWLDGEDDIRFWHETDVGYAGRQPL